MSDWSAAILGSATAALAVSQAVLWSRVARLRRRTGRRSLLVSPEDHVRLQKRLFDERLRRDLRERGARPRFAPEFRSEWGEDMLLYDLFEGRSEGVFVEAGALDGYRASVTYVFEAIGWRGLLVEPMPERAAECAKRRPGSTVIHAALGGAGGVDSTEFMIPLEESAEPSAHRVQAGMGTEHLQVLRKAGATLRRVRVPLMTMSSALTRAGIDTADFVVLDVEGAELDVLDGFDPGRARVRVMVVEENSLGRDDRVRQRLEARGYRRALWVGANGVYVREDDSEMRERAARLANTVYSPFVRTSAPVTSDPRLEG
jgi:FkbM family methyltransferase